MVTVGVVENLAVLAALLAYKVGSSYKNIAV